MSTPAVTYTPEQVADVEKAKAVVRRVLADPNTRIYGPDAVQLMNWSHNFKPVSVAA